MYAYTYIFSQATTKSLNQSEKELNIARINLEKLEKKLKISQGELYERGEELDSLNAQISELLCISITPEKLKKQNDLFGIDNSEIDKDKSIIFQNFDLDISLTDIRHTDICNTNIRENPDTFDMNIPSNSITNKFEKDNSTCIVLSELTPLTLKEKLSKLNTKINNNVIYRRKIANDEFALDNDENYTGNLLKFSGSCDKEIGSFPYGDYGEGIHIPSRILVCIYMFMYTCIYSFMCIHM
jgi:hypothetical protein